MPLKYELFQYHSFGFKTELKWEKNNLVNKLIFLLKMKMFQFLTDTG